MDLTPIIFVMCRPFLNVAIVSLVVNTFIMAYLVVWVPYQERLQLLVCVCVMKATLPYFKSCHPLLFLFSNNLSAFRRRSGVGRVRQTREFVCRDDWVRRHGFNWKLVSFSRMLLPACSGVEFWANGLENIASLSGRCTAREWSRLWPPLVFYSWSAWSKVP